MAAAMMELADEQAGSPGSPGLQGRLRLFATVGEETGLLGAEQLTKLGYANDVEAMIIGEPTGRRIVYAHKGIVTANIASYGKSAHSSMPEHGVNAIDHLLLFYNRMETAFAKRQEENAALGKLTHCNSVIEGGEQHNIVPDRASLSVNIRTIPEAGNEDVLGMLREIITELNENVENMRLEITILQSDPPVFSDIHSRLMQTTQAEAKKMFGEELPVLGAPGATDAAKYIQGNKSMQIIVFGPGNDTMHQDNECVEEENYLEMIDLYKNIAGAYFAG